MVVYYFLSFVLFFFYFILFHGGFLSTGSGSLFSSFLLCRIIDIACCIAMMLISLKFSLMVFSGILNFSSKIFIERMCVVALAIVVMTINGSTLHPLLAMLFISGWDFSIFPIIVFDENLSLQNVNSINYILKLFARVVGGFAWYDSPLIHMYLVWILHCNDIFEDHMSKEVAMVGLYFQVGCHWIFLRS